MASDIEEADRLLRTMRTALEILPPILEDISKNAAALQNLVTMRPGPIVANSIEAILNNVNEHLEAIENQVNSSGTSVSALQKAQELHEAQAKSLEDERKALQDAFNSKAQELEEQKKKSKQEYQTKCDDLETEKQRLQKLKTDSKQIWNDKMKKVDEERESLKTARARCNFDQNKLAQDKAGIVFTLQSTSAHHLLVMRLRRSLQDRLNSLNTTEEKAASQTDKMLESTRAMTENSAKLVKSFTSTTETSKKMIESSTAMTEASKKMSESSTAMGAATEEFKNYRTQTQATILQKDVQIAQLKLDVQTTCDNATAQRATLVDAQQRQLQRARDRTMAAEGALRELRHTHDAGIHHTTNRMMDLFERFHGDATAAQQARNDLNASSTRLSTTAGVLSTTSDQLKESSKKLTDVNTELKASSTALHILQDVMKTSGEGLVKSLADMQDLSTGVKASIDVFTKHQPALLADAHERRAAITAMDAARWQMQEVRQSFYGVKQSYFAKRERYNDLTFELEADRHELEVDRQEIMEQEAQYRAEYERVVGQLEDERKIFDLRVASFERETDSLRSKKRQCLETSEVSSAKRQRIAKTQVDEEDSEVVVVHENLVEQTSSHTGPDMMFDDYEPPPEMGDDDIVLSTHPVEFADAETRSSTPLREVPSQNAVETLPEPTPAAAQIPVPAPPTAPQIPNDGIDQIYRLFETPVAWTQAKRDDLLVHLREKYQGKTFENIKETLNKAAKDHPRFKAELKCFIWHGWKDGRSCVPKGKANTRANCPQHCSTADGLCLIISQATDGIHQWSVTDR